MIERANFAVIRQQWALVTFSPRSFENSTSAGCSTPHRRRPSGIEAGGSSFCLRLVGEHPGGDVSGS
jgi:hypothetical protein